MQMRIALMLIAATAMAQARPGPDEGRRIDAARTDLGLRLTLAPEQVEVRSKTSRLWPDSLLGCQRVAAPIEKTPTRGSELVLFAGGHVHYYYARPGERYRYCELPSSKKTGAVKPPSE